MARRRTAAAELDFEPAEAGPSPLTGRRQDAWSDTERTIVKSALASGTHRCTDLGLLPSEFSDARARMVWAGALARIEAGARIVWLDGGLVAEVAKTVPLEDARRSVAWVKEAADEADDASVDALVASLRDRGFCARVYALGAHLRTAAEPGTPEAAARASKLVRELYDVDEGRQATSTGPDLTSAVDAFDEWQRQARAEAEESGKLPVLGMPCVDRWTGKPLGKLTVVAAESHVGKTGFNAGAVLATARRGIPAAFVSSDDPWPEIVSRMAAECGRFNPQDVSQAQRSFGLDEKIATARAELARLPIFGVEIKDRSVDGTLAAIRRAASRGARLIVLDHWNSLRRPRWVSETADRRDASDEMIGVILACAAERDVHLIIAGQLNRDRNRKEVTLNDLRETQSLGEAAHNVIGLWRSDGGVTCGIIKAKGRSGAGKRFDLVRDDCGILVEKGEEAVF